MAGTDERKIWVDALRAVAILMVIYGHCLHGDESLFAFTNPVKMPLFFAISGYLFSIKGKSFISFSNSLFKRVVIPWLLFGSIILIPVCFTLGDGGGVFS